MSLRARLTALVSVAVALAIVVSALVSWGLLRQTLLHDIDDRLLTRQEQLTRIPDPASLLPNGSTVDRRLLRLVEDEPMGIQLVARDGGVVRQLTFGAAARAVADPSWTPPEPVTSAPRLDDVTLEGHAYRLLSVELPGGAILRLFQPMESVVATLTQAGWALAATAATGVALAAAIGWIVSRSALRPVTRLLAATESVRRTKDLAARIDVPTGRRNELGRLAESMNAMLAALETARGEQRELIENASHELRTPLAVLRNDFGLLLRAEAAGSPGLPADERRTLVQDLDAQVAALGELVDEIVTLSRGESESERVAPVALRALVERAAGRTRRENPAVTVTVTGDDEAEVRPAMLERAVTNLVRNAIQASRDGGEVEVELLRRDGRHVIEVRDRGHGLDPDELPRLFDRFVRGRASRAHRGSGLGLAIVTQAAAAHDGSVAAAPRPGGGAVFTLSWPTGSSSSARG